VQAAAKLGEWVSVPFHVLPTEPAAAPLNTYQASQTKRVEIAPPTLGDEPARFFRLMVE